MTSITAIWISAGRAGLVMALLVPVLAWGRRPSVLPGEIAQRLEFRGHPGRRPGEHYGRRPGECYGRRPGGS